jgi:threonine aldolase
LRLWQEVLLPKGFGSDNHSGIHPLILKALEACNQEHAPSYGTDELSVETEKKFQHLFGKEAKVFFVYNGTAANSLSLRALAKPWNAVLCADVSHLNVDECGAPEFMSGAKLLALPSQHGKLSLQDISASLVRQGDQHYSQAKVISLSQPTELGTCYSLAELKAIAEFAHARGLFLHIDGSRIANAVVSLNTTFEDLITKTGIDVLSFGGTKNGLMVGEAVIFLNGQLAQDFKYIRKQSGQLPSKTRFIAAQFSAYLENHLWKEIAAHSLKMAQFLWQEIKDISGVEVTHPVQSNAVFVRLPQAWIKPLREKFFFYVWDEKTFECRLMTSFDTQPEEVIAFAAELRRLSGEKNETSAHSL